MSSSETDTHPSIDPNIFELDRRIKFYTEIIKRDEDHLLNMKNIRDDLVEEKYKLEREYYGIER